MPTTVISMSPPSFFFSKSTFKSRWYDATLTSFAFENEAASTFKPSALMMMFRSSYAESETIFFFFFFFFLKKKKKAEKESTTVAPEAGLPLIFRFFRIEHMQANKHEQPKQNKSSSKKTKRQPPNGIEFSLLPLQTRTTTTPKNTLKTKR
mmetsp:Transcript_30623/g.59021  ORF Transcript_30623/g.59021 Transcript_30623/m.59021 type:complete len:151 (+) Transcript_30623:2017-2469(+)